jgi:hypothetical protein
MHTGTNTLHLFAAWYHKATINDRKHLQIREWFGSVNNHHLQNIILEQFNHESALTKAHSPHGNGVDVGASEPSLLLFGISK